MRKRLGLWAVLGVVVGLVAAGPSFAAASTTPRWVKHVQNYPGGISNGVRAYMDPGLRHAQAAAKFRSPSSGSAASSGPLQNLQVNGDSSPPLPQDETQIVHSVFNDKIAVGAAN